MDNERNWRFRLELCCQVAALVPMCSNEEVASSAPTPSAITFSAPTSAPPTSVCGPPGPGPPGPPLPPPSKRPSVCGAETGGYCHGWAAR